MNIRKAFNEELQKNGYLVHKYHYDAEFHAKVHEFNQALEVVQLALISDEVADPEWVITTLINGFFDGRPE